MRRLTRSPQARRDLKKIGRYIAEQSKSLLIAQNVLARIDEKCQLCLQFPEMGELCPDLADRIRRTFVGNYVIYYRTEQNVVQIVRVLHGSQSMPSAWSMSE